LNRLGAGAEAGAVGLAVEVDAPGHPDCCRAPNAKPALGAVDAAGAKEKGAGVEAGAVAGGAPNENDVDGVAVGAAPRPKLNLLEIEGLVGVKSER
jgi:hypothetical protein